MKKLNNRIKKFLKLIIISFFLISLISLISLNQLFTVSSSSNSIKKTESNENNEETIINDLIIEWLKKLSNETVEELLFNVSTKKIRKGSSEKIKIFFSSNVKNWNRKFMTLQSDKYVRITSEEIAKKNPNQYKIDGTLLDGTAGNTESSDSRRKSVELLKIIKKDNESFFLVKEILEQMNKVFEYESFNDELIKLLFEIEEQTDSNVKFNYAVGKNEFKKIIDIIKLKKKYNTDLKKWFESLENKKSKWIRLVIKNLKLISSKLSLISKLKLFENLNIKESTNLLKMFNSDGIIDEEKFLKNYKLEDLMKIKVWFSLEKNLKSLYKILIKYEFGLTTIKKIKNKIINFTYFFSKKYLEIKLETELEKPFIFFVYSFKELIENIDNNGEISDSFFVKTQELKKLFLLFDWIKEHYKKFDEQVNLHFLRIEIEELQKSKQQIIQNAFEKKYKIIKKYKWNEKFNESGLLKESIIKKINKDKKELEKYKIFFNKIIMKNILDIEKKEQFNLIRTSSLSTFGSLLGFLLIFYFLFKNKYAKFFLNKIKIKK